jgi:hypothetical protein
MMAALNYVFYLPEIMDFDVRGTELLRRAAILSQQLYHCSS